MKDVFRSPAFRFNESFFKENEIPTDVQLMRVGTFYKDGQEIQVTKKHLKAIIHNFKEGVRGIDLMIDYGHNSDKEAAAWIKDLYLSEDENDLWATVDWSESGKQKVMGKEYRYLSADFSFDYEDNETRKRFGPTLFGAGLTNRPVIKRMNAVVQLSEDKKEYSMELEEMKKKMAQLEEENSGLKKKLEGFEKSKSDSEEEMKEKDKKLSEANDKIKTLEATMSEDQAKSKKENDFNKMFAEGKVVEAQRESFMSGDMVKFAELSEKINTDGKAHGDGGEPDVTGDAEEQVIALAEKKIEKNSSLTFSEATAQVLSENKELKEKYEAKFQ